MTRVVFVTTAFGDGVTGPETYVRYLWESFADDRKIDFHLVAPSFPSSHPRWHTAGSGVGSLALYRRLAHAAMRVALELKAPNRRVILHVNNSNLHPSLIGYAGLLWGQVNDYENADLWRRAGQTIRRAGFRRFFALTRRRWLERRFLARQDLTLCNSDYTRKKILAEYHPPHAQNIITLHKAVDVRYFARPAQIPPDPLNRPPAAQKYIFVGSDIARKGLDTLLLAVASLPTEVNWHLTVVGSTKAETMAAFPQLPPLNYSRIIFTGSVDKEKLRKMLWCSNVFVLPSRAEALGVVLLEALAAGLVVVATNVGGIPEIVSNPAAGVLIPPDDSIALATALQNVPISPEGMSPAVAKIVESFSTPVMCRRLRELYLQAT